MKVQIASNAQDAIKTDVCELTAAPERFDGKLIRIEAYISSEFEDSTLHDPSCPEEALVNARTSIAAEPHIWTEFADHVAYWHVKGFAPLVDDEQLRLLRAVLSKRGGLHQMARATMSGTFYAGKSLKINGRVVYSRGFGHMGCCSLFVISHVESLAADYASELDYTWADWNVELPQGCYSEQMLGLPTNKMIRSWQEERNKGRDDWHHDPRQTAEDELKRIKSGEFGPTGGKTEILAPGKSDLNPPADTRSAETLIESSSVPYLKRYEYIEADRITRFVILVGRPYWLETLAGSPRNVIWAPVGASVINCSTKASRKR